MPILLMFPRLGSWRGGYSMLGLGDVAIPGTVVVLGVHVEAAPLARRADRDCRAGTGVRRYVVELLAPMGPVQPPTSQGRLLQRRHARLLCGPGPGQPRGDPHAARSAGACVLAVCAARPTTVARPGRDRGCSAASDTCRRTPGFDRRCCTWCPVPSSRPRGWHTGATNWTPCGVAPRWRRVLRSAATRWSRRTTRRRGSASRRRRPAAVARRRWTARIGKARGLHRQC